MAQVSCLECAVCHKRLSGDVLQSSCLQCGGLLLVRYELRDTSRPAPGGLRSLWRYSAALPSVERISMNEGWTPLRNSRRTPRVFWKDEGVNPGGSFACRGMSVAVSMARDSGYREVTASVEDDAGAALAAYAAAADMTAHLLLSRDIGLPSLTECIACGAHVEFADGPVGENALIPQQKVGSRWFDLSQSPFLREGEKTIAYEIVEQLDWSYPDAVIWSGDGTGIVSFWKAFEEMEALGWVSGQRSRLIAVSSREEGQDSLLTGIVRASQGISMDVQQDEVLASLQDWARHEGFLLFPNGAAAATAYRALLASGFLSGSERVVLVNPASGRNSSAWIAERLGLKRPAERRLPSRNPVGGIITPV